MEIEKKIEDFIKAMNFPILNKQIITEKSIKKIECEGDHVQIDLQLGFYAETIIEEFKNILLDGLKDFTKNKISCHVETDMRAMYNPTRMKIIKEVSLKLMNKINSFCPSCNNPGFGVVKAKAGLLCSSCSMPTRSVSAHVYNCQKCNYETEKMYPNGKSIEDPMYCDFCNP